MSTSISGRRSSSPRLPRTATQVRPGATLTPPMLPGTLSRSKGDIAAARYDDRVVVTPEQLRRATGPVPEGRDRYGAFRHRQSLLRRRHAQLLGIHWVVWQQGSDWVCTCGLAVPAGSDLNVAPGHLALPSRAREVYVLVVEASHHTHMVVCQRCEYRSPRLNEHVALVERTRHEHACLPPVPLGTHRPEETC